MSTIAQSDLTENYQQIYGISVPLLLFLANCFDWKYLSFYTTYVKYAFKKRKKIWMFFFHFKLR